MASASGSDGSASEFYTPPSLRENSYWSRLQGILSEVPSDGEGLAKVMRACHEHVHFELDSMQHIGLRGLFKAIEDLETTVKGFDFYKLVLPKIAEWARDASDVKKMPILTEGSDAKCCITTRQARHMLALAFFLALPDPDTEGRLGSLMFHRLYRGTGIGCERTKCLLHYFYHEAIGTYPETEEVVFERRVIPETARVNWAKSTKKFTDAKFSAKHRIEDMEAEADGIVDFANKRLQIFTFIESCTQEEVMFSCRPVLKLSMLVCPMLGPEEVALLRGARPYADYVGYLGSFKFSGDSAHLVRFSTEHEHERKKKKPKEYDVQAKAKKSDIQEKEMKEEKQGEEAAGNAEAARGERDGSAASSASYPPEVIAIDAVVNHGSLQFRTKVLDRDLNKAWLGFGGGFESKSPSGPISTGMWGCGVFRGDPLLKCLQQAMAAAQVGRELKFSTFGNSKCESQFRRVHAAIRTAGVTVGQLYQILVEFGKAEAESEKEVGFFGIFLSRKSRDLEGYLRKQLNLQY